MGMQAVMRTLEGSRTVKMTGMTEESGLDGLEKGSGRESGGGGDDEYFGKVLRGTYKLHRSWYLSLLPLAMGYGRC